MLAAVGWMVLPPQKDKFKRDTCEHNLIWKQGLSRCNQVKMRSHWCRVTLNPIWLMILWEEAQTWGHWPSGIRGREHSAAVGSQGTQGRLANHRGWKEGFSPGAFRESTALPAPGFGTRSLQSREMINFRCFKSPSLQYLVTAALETDTLAWAHTSVFSALLRPGIASPVTPPVTIREISQIWYQTTSLLCSGPSKTSMPVPVPWPLLRDQLPPHPLLTLLRHTCLPAVPPTWQFSSFLRTPCLRPLP